MQQDLAKVDPNKVTGERRLFNEKVAGLNEFSQQAVRAKTATQQWTEALIKQDIHIGQAAKSGKMFNDVLREQFQLQKMTAVQWSKNASGQMSADIIIPKGIDDATNRYTSSLKENIRGVMAGKVANEHYNEALDVLKMRLGMANQLLGSSADNMIKWGKNTQWAGRQLMVGFTVPFAAFAALAGTQAYKINQEFTRVTKVYDFTAQGAKQAAEAQQLHAQSMDMGIQVAQKYGKALQETISVEADLAATGLKGRDLIESTAQVQRASTLGEMDHQATVKATIALQAIYGQQWQKTGGIAKNTADAFNYMNSIENATNLTMQDFVDAIPRAAGPLHELGGTVQDMGVLLTAMKASGVDAAVGANALKSSLGSLINPSKNALKILDELTHGQVDLHAIVEKNGGDYMKTMTEFSAAISNLSNLDKQKVIEALFGKQQYARIGGIINQLGLVRDTTTQVGRAFAVNEQGVIGWSNTAQGELEKVRASASGRFRIAVESIKAELAKVGEPFLNAATMVVNAFTWIMKTFNKFPDFAKHFIMLGVVLGALAGPLIMMTGLLGNLIGQGLRMGHFLLNLTTEMKAMTAEERAAEMLARQHTSAWGNQAKAAQGLAGSISMLTAKLEELAAAQAEAEGRTAITGQATNALMVNGNRIVAAPNGGVMRANGQFASDEEKAVYNEMIASQAVAEEQSTAVKRNWAGIAANTGLAVGMMGAMVSGGNHLLSTLTNVIFAASLLGPTLAKGVKAMVGRSGLGYILGTMFSGGSIAKIIAPLKTGLTSALSTIVKFAPQLALAGAAAAFVGIKIHNALAQAKKDQDDITGSAKTWGEILGFIYEETGKIKNAQGKGVSSIDQMASSFRKANKAASDNLQTLGAQEDKQKAINAAIDEGLKARLHGANSTEAQQVVQVALRVAGMKDDEIKDVMNDQVSKIDWNNIQTVINQHMTQIVEDLPNIFTNAFSQSSWEGVWRSLRSDKGLNANAREAATNAGREFFNAWNQAGDGQQKLTVFNNFKALLDKQTNAVFDGLKGDLGKKFRELGVTSVSELSDAMLGHGDIYNKNKGAINKLLRQMGEGDFRNIQNAAQAMDLLTKAFADNANVSKDDMKNVHSFADLAGYLNQPIKSVAQATADYTKVVGDGTGAWQHYSEAQRLATLNLYRHQAGLSDATSLSQGFTNAVHDTTNALNDQSIAMAKVRVTQDNFVQVTQGAMSGAQGAVLSAADEIWSRYAQAQVDSIKTSTAAADRQSKNIEDNLNRQIRASDRFYNQKIKKLQREIKAEKAADDMRQKIFDAEQTRIQRLAEMQNNQIDFNTNLNLGNLDEAAKIFNTMQATQDKNALDDANAAAKDASQRKIDNWQAQIDHLTAVRDAHKASLQKQLDAEKAANDRRKQLADQNTQNQKAALQEQLADRKRNLDMELATIKAHIPLNAAEYDKQVKQIEKAYRDAGVPITSFGDNWAQYIASALQSNIATAAASLKNEVDWQNSANSIANQFAEGAFGLTIKQWATWINTGNLPKGGLHPQANAPTPSGSGGGRTYMHQAAHGGGTIGDFTRQNLLGRDPKSALWDDEVMVRAQKGEYMINKKAHQLLGTEFLDRLNDGVLFRHGGGPIGPAGVGYTALVSMMMGALAGTMNKASEDAAGIGGVGGMAGGDVVSKIKQITGYNLGQSQLNNAAAIIGVGKMMGASQRDMIVSIMTALQESGLNNLNFGDRDSLGLFQQRPSMGWGTPHQILNPQYAAHKFFDGLLAIKNRDNMPMTLEAQAVQRSAYPYAYAKWQTEATDVVGRILPSLFTGGTIQFDNTIANLHRDEKVLTAPLSKSLEKGIQNLESGNASYDVTIDLRGATISNDVDIEKAVQKALDKAESKRGRTRRVGPGQ